MTEATQPDKKPTEEVNEVDTAKAVDPNANPGEESTPLFDELDTANSYKVDVKRALDRETDDGKGDTDPGESDFVSFATDDVEKEVDA